MEKYIVNNMTIGAILGLIKAKDIAIPEIQRPFVWKNRQVRDLMDSLYKGYPVGYIILWKNPNVKLKDGTIASGKKVIIDGQQRITALMTAVAGQRIINADYKECRVKIAFDPIAAFSGDEEAEVFAVQTPAHERSSRWIPDIAEKGVIKTLGDIEAAVLSDNFWDVLLTQNLESTSTINPTYQVYLAAQVYFNDTSLLSNNISVRTLIELGGDVHHVFPKQYLKDNHFEKNKYNQNANYAFLDRPVNESIGKAAPCEYFRIAREQCFTEVAKPVGSIKDYDELLQNLATNCIPADVFDMDAASYEKFMEERRSMMAAKIKKYYYSL